jgi:FAD synthetase
MCGPFCGRLTYRIALYTTRGTFYRTRCRGVLPTHGRYTSLGSTYNTFPNPALRVQPPHSPSESGEEPAHTKQPPPYLCTSTEGVPPVDPVTVNGNGSPTHAACPPQYRPAYELLDGSLERAGRGPVTASRPEPAQSDVLVEGEFVMKSNS